MYAVIVTGGKQYRVEEGEVLRVEKLSVDEGASFDFDQVLLVGEGDQIQVGRVTRSTSSSSGGANTTCAVRGTARATPRLRSPALPPADHEQLKRTY